MRWLCVSLALGISALAAASTSLPRGNDEFVLGAPRTEVAENVQSRGLEVLSSSPSHIACVGQSRGVEYEQYDFAPMVGGEGRLWRVTIAYRVPYTRADFDSLRNQLVEDLKSDPGQIDEPQANDPDGVHKITWVDAATSVQLAARWPERPDPRADRMLLVWTDRKLQKLVEAQRKGGKKK